MPEERQGDMARIVEEFPESVQLTRNSKGYTWELKARARYGKLEEAIDRLEQINNTMLTKFGSEK